MSDKPARIGFSVTAGDAPYYLTRLRLNPHETRAIDLRKLRDAQKPDFRKNKLPAEATDGSVNWIRLDDVPVMGRLVVISRHRGVASSYDCCTCFCPASFNGFTTSPSPSFDMIPNTTMDCTCQESLKNCNNVLSYYDETSAATWSSSNTAVAYMDSTVRNRVHALAGGTATIKAGITAYVYNYNPFARTCTTSTIFPSASSTCYVEPVPTNFHEVGWSAQAGGVLHFDYAWGSSSGKVSDLTDCTVNETVKYPGRPSFRVRSAQAPITTALGHSLSPTGLRRLRRSRRTTTRAPAESTGRCWAPSTS